MDNENCFSIKYAAKVPRVSIGMPVYNGETFIQEAIDSLLAQTFTDFELIISDNASTDSTESICREYAAKDDRIRYVRQVENLGPSVNFKYVLDEAVGEYFMWAAYDDLRSNNFIEILSSSLDENADHVSAFGVFEEIDDTGNCFGEKIILNYSSETSRLRICKYWLDFRALRDVWVYGLHRRLALKKARIKPWVWVNKDNPINIAHPILTYMLAKGKYYFHSNETIFYRRVLKTGSLWSKNLKHSNLVWRELKYILIKINLIMRSISEAMRGSGSIITCLMSFFCIFLSVIRELTKRYSKAATYVLIGKMRTIR